jgi:ketosteroid isomerase-like protein
MTTREPPVDHQALLLRAYLAYNAQDLPRLLALVSEDVDWPDDAGGRMHGRPALASYWIEQWTRVRVHDHPVAFTQWDDERIAVQVRQVVRSLDGAVRSTGEFIHLHRLDDGRIQRLDIEAGSGFA